MKSSAMLLLICFLLCCPRARSQTLVYSLTYVDAPASRRARFANFPPFPGLRTEQQELAVERNTWKTDIYSVSIADGKRALLFSDEGSNLELKGGAAVSATGEAYASATWRERTTTPYRGVRSEEGVYEISLDGSRRVRRVLGVQQNQPQPLLNQQSSEGVFEIFSHGKWLVSIYAVPQWTVLETWDLAPLIKAHCAACEPLSYGWMADGKRLFFVLGLVGEESADHPEIHDTPYVVSEMGADLGAIPPELGALQLPGYVHPPTADREFLGQLPDGSYLFNDFVVPKGGPFNDAKPYLVVFNPISKSRRQFSLKFPIGRAFISPSGKYLAYAEERLTADARSEEQLWTIDLDSGVERELYSTPPTQRASSLEPNVRLNLLGWLDKH